MNQRGRRLCTGFICSCPGSGELLKVTAGVIVPIDQVTNRLVMLRNLAGVFPNAVRLEKFVSAGYRRLSGTQDAPREQTGDMRCDFDRDLRVLCPP